MAQQINDALTNADCSPQGLDGGLNLKGDPTRLAPPATTRSDNAHYDTVGSVSQLPGFVSIADKSGLGQKKPFHIYNLHAKDPGAPSQTGDMMVHGEYQDTIPSGFAQVTAPMWASSNGAVLNRAQPVLPFTSKTRNFAGRLSATSDDATPVPVNANPVMLARQESVPAGSIRKYGAGYASRPTAGARFSYVVGAIDGMTEEFNDIVSLPSTFTEIDVGGVQGASYWILVFNNTSNNTLTVTRLPFTDTGTTTAAQITGVTTTITNGSAFQILQHAGRTYVAYFTNVATPLLTFYDVLTGVNYSSPIGGTLTAGFCVFSPYTHQSQSGSQHLCVVKNNNAYVMHRPDDTSSFVLTGSATALPGPEVSASSPIIQVTGCALFKNNLRGSGGGSALDIIIFRNLPEVQSLPIPNYNTYFNQIAVDQLSFTAAANPANTGFLSLSDTQVARLPGGAQLSSQAFAASPSQSNFAGATGSRQALCLIRSGAYEPYYNFQGLQNASPISPPNHSSYGQPTYFLIDQGARIVGRFLESIGPVDSSNPTNLGTGASSTVTAPASTKMVGIPTPLFSWADDNASDDTAALTITLPAWSQVYGSFLPATTIAGAVYSQPLPIETVHAPTAIVCSLSSAVASCPATQGGPYTVTSGCLTTTHDGYAMAEANFHFACPNPILSPLVSGTALGSSGVYTYVAVLEWFDSQGQLVRSTPSNPIPYYTAGTYYGATVTIPKIPTSKVSAYPNRIRVKIYRSIKDQKNDANFYLCATSTASAGVSTMMPLSSWGGMFATVNDGTYLDNLAITSSSPAPPTNVINARPRLYTGITANNPFRIFTSNPPPAMYWQTASKGRIFGLAQVLGQYRLYYTAVTSNTIAPEWNSFNYVPIPADIGDVRSMEAIDRAIVVFGTRCNAIVSGDGPANGNTDGVPRPAEGFDIVYPIPSPAGILGTGGPTRVPEGLLFQGLSGVQQLDRSLAVSAIGAPVDPITGRQTGNIGVIYGRGVTLPSLQSVVWPCAKGPALVYSYLTKKFSIWPLLTGACALAQRQDGTIIVGLQPVSGAAYLPYSLTASGADLGVLSATAYSPAYIPAPTAPGLVLETPWILPSGASGAEARVWNVCLTGTWLGPHQLQVEQAYNYEAYSLTRVIDMSVAPRQYQAIIQPLANTRMIAVRYRITLLPVTNLTAGYAMATLSDLVLFSAKQQGTVRTSSALRG